jgi:hypothetical protein
MLWWQFALLGTAGGALVEALEIFRWTAAWQDARRTRSGALKRNPPTWRTFVDLPAHAFMLPARAALGAAAATLFGITGQVTGAYGAVAFGCAAPLILAQLGTIPQIARTVSDVPAVRKPDGPDGAETARLTPGPVPPNGTGVVTKKESQPS